MAAVQDTEVLPKYSLPHVTERPDEISRLKLIHDALIAYFGGKLTPAPIESNPPKSILEMGAGSGIWAVKAAETFPQSKVLAVDLAEMPLTLPSNVTFHAADLSKPLKFISDQFDLIHARLIFMHLPDLETVFSRTIDLIKPGGWFLIEDLILRVCDEDSYIDSNPITRNYFDTLKEIKAEQGMDNCSPLKYESLLKASGMFSEINVRKIHAPLSGQTDDPFLRQIGGAIRVTIDMVVPQLPGRLSDPRLTEAMAQDLVAEMNNPSNKFWADFYVVCARKSL